MRPPSCRLVAGRRLVTVFFAAAALLSARPVRAQHVSPGRSISDASAAAGENLFTGRASFGNGGPPCASCHTIASLPLFGGGTLGPDLTGSVERLGPEGVQSALETLFFSIMAPVYARHPVTSAEQQNLIEYLARASAAPAPPSRTPWIALAAVAGLLAMLLLTGALGRRRLRALRRPLLHPQGQGGRRA